MQSERLFLVVMLCCMSMLSTNAYAAPNPVRLIEKFAKSAGNGAKVGKYYHKGFERATEDYYYRFSRAGVPKSLEELSKEKKDSTYWDTLSNYSHIRQIRSRRLGYMNIEPSDYEGWHERYGYLRMEPMRVRSQQQIGFVEDVSGCFIPFRCQIYTDNMKKKKKESLIEYEIDFFPNH